MQVGDVPEVGREVIDLVPLPRDFLALILALSARVAPSTLLLGACESVADLVVPQTGCRSVWNPYNFTLSNFTETFRHVVGLAGDASLYGTISDPN